MDTDATFSSKENINPGCVTNSGVIGRGEAVILDSVTQILDVLRTGQLDTNKDEAGQVTNGQTNEPVTVAPHSVDQRGCENRGFNDYGESSGVSRKQVQPSQQYDTDTTSISSEEDEEDPVGNREVLPRQGVNMQSKLENCKNVQVGEKMEISGAMTVNTILNVMSPPDEGRSGHGSPRDQPNTAAHHEPHHTVPNSEGVHRYGSVPQHNAYRCQGDAVNSGATIVYLPPHLPPIQEPEPCCRCLWRIYTVVFIIIIIAVASFIINKIVTFEENHPELDTHTPSWPFN